MGKREYVEGMLLDDESAPLQDIYSDNKRLNLIIEPYYCDDLELCANADENVLIE